MNILTKSVLYFCASALVACGGSGGGSGSGGNTAVEKPTPSPSNPDNPSPVEAQTAKVIDGYLENAIVCLDANNNYRCDAGEVNERTNAQGDFKLEKFTGKVVLAEIRADEAKDNGTIVKDGYILRGVAGPGKHITPFSTLMLALQEAGENKDSVAADLRSKLKLPAETDLAMDYIATDNKAMQRLAVMAVSMIQKINKDALALDAVNPQSDQGVIEFISWHQLSLEALASGANILAANPDMSMTDVVAAWQKDSNVALSAARIEQVKKDQQLNNTDADNDGIADRLDNCPVNANADQKDFDSDGAGDVCDADADGDNVDDSIDNCLLKPNPDQEDLDGDGYGSACDDQELMEFTKLSATGAVLADDATNYACVTQNMADDKAIDAKDRNTWIVLIAADATYADLGVTSSSVTGTDKFWDFKWQHNGREQGPVDGANKLRAQYSSAMQPMEFVTHLNELKYCGFDDWRIPFVSEMQTLNTRLIAQDSNVKSIDQSIFRNYAAHVTQAAGYSVSSSYAHRKLPYFWTADVLDANDDTRSGYEFKQYRHPKADLPAGEVRAEGSSGDFFALRAVRKARYTKLQANGSDHTTGDWACVRDNDKSGRTHWLNPIGDYSDVAQADITTKIAAVNAAKVCNFGDWRLATKAEISSVIPVFSNAFFNIGARQIGVPTSFGSTNWYANDYAWIQPVDSNKDDILRLWDITSTSLESRFASGWDRYNIKLVLIRDDVASGLALDAKVTEAEAKNAGIAQLKSDFDMNAIDDTLATNVATLTTEFNKFSTLKNLISARQKALNEFEPLVAVARTQFDALFIGEQTADRLADVLALEADVPVLKAALKADAESLKTSLDELYAVLDNLSPITNEEKAQLLFAGIQSGRIMTQLYATLGSDYNVVAAQVAAINTARTTEFTNLGVVVKLNHGYQKIAKNGSVADTLAAIGDDWRCVQQQVVVGDFTQTFTWALPVVGDRNLTYAEAHARRTAMNGETLCGINAAADSAVNTSVDGNDKDGWVIPDYNQLDLVKTEDFTDGSSNYKTLDRSVFATHEASLAAHTYYWAEDTSTSSYYVDVLRFADSGDNPADSDAREIQNDVRANADNKANLMLFHSRLTYVRSDETCGSDRVHYGDKCYRRVDANKKWNEALAYCVAQGESLIAKQDDSDNLRLGIALALKDGNRYWTREAGSSWAYVLHKDGGNWKRYGSSRSKDDGYPFVCVGPTPGNELPKPAAPTNGVVEDNLDTFGWNEVSGYSGNDKYEYSLDAGVTWQVVTANPQPVGYAARNAGDVQVRVKAMENSNAPGTALLAGAFTETHVAAPTNPQVNDTTDTFGWDEVSGFTGADKYEYSMDGGSTWQAATANPQRISVKDVAIGDVQVRVKANGSVNKAGAVLASNAAFTALVGPSCEGGNKAEEVKGRCYVRIDDTKRRDDALAYCQSISADMVSRNNPDLAEIGTALALNTSADYGLKEYWRNSRNYVYRLQYRSGSWRADNGDGRPFYNYPFICVK